MELGPKVVLTVILMVYNGVGNGDSNVCVFVCFQEPRSCLGTRTAA